MIDKDPRPKASGLETLAVFSDPIAAQLARELLEASDVPVFLQGEHVVSVTRLPGLGGIALQVPPEHAEAARKLLADLENQPGLDESFEEPEHEEEAEPPRSTPNVLAVAGLLMGIAALIGARYGLPGTLGGGLTVALSLGGALQARRGAGHGLGAALVGMILGLGALAAGLITGR